MRDIACSQCANARDEGRAEGAAAERRKIRRKLKRAESYVAAFDAVEKLTRAPRVKRAKTRGTK